ncbi:MAG TPA: STM4015 family protein [Tepidisphaeraceae bacterium]|nr:STM4015 family protein [Tepidisphaeraceae bacterium]
MTVRENLTTFMGREVIDWEEDAKPRDPKKFVYRFRVSYDDGEEKMTELLASFIQNPAAAKVEAMVIGAWGEVASGDSSQPIVEALAAARDRLTNLKYLFFGDIIAEESEISWINQTDLSPLLEAYPKLEHLTIRGGMGLSLGTPRHEKLRELTIQSGGLPASVIHEIASGELPALNHLELWLGEPNYGGDATVDDLAQIFKGDRFPKLKYLGLRNSEIADDIAAAISLAPILPRLEVLDLSLGTLGDEGAKALAASAAIKKLKLLDIHHHFVSPEGVKALEGLGIEVDAEDKQEEHEWRGERSRFISIAE